MVARVEKAEARRRPSDDDLLRARHRAQPTPGSAAGPTPATVRWVDNQRSRWGSCTPVDRTIRLSAPAAGHARLGDRLRARPRAGPPARARPQPPLLGAGSDRYPQAERAKAWLDGYSAGGSARAPTPATDRVDSTASRSRASRDQLVHLRLEVRQVVQRPPAHVERLVAGRVLRTRPARRAAYRTSRWWTSPRGSGRTPPRARRGGPAAGRDAELRDAGLLGRLAQRGRRPGRASPGSQ